MSNMLYFGERLPRFVAAGRGIRLVRDGLAVAALKHNILGVGSPLGVRHIDAFPAGDFSVRR